MLSAVTKLRKTLAAAATVALTAGALALTAGPAQATSYNGACGTGYKVIDSMRVGGTGLGTAYLTYNNGWNCVVVVTDTPGARAYMEAILKRSADSEWAEDSGTFTQYAGPVYVYAAGSCVDWGGNVGSKLITFITWDDHCG